MSVDKRQHNVFERLRKIPCEIVSDFKSYTKHEKIIHLLVWLGASIWFNIPQFEVTIGAFRGTDLSLLMPMFYGVPVNALIFYGNAILIRKHLKNETRLYLRLALSSLISISMLEFFLDVGYYFLFYGDLNESIVYETFYGTFLMNGIFFYLPSFVFGVVKDWKSERVGDGLNKVVIYDGHQEVYVDRNELQFVESDGNYVTFHTTQGTLVERTSLTDLENRLPSDFIRCHKSYIVNQNLIKKKNASTLWVAENRIPIGRKFKNNLRQ